MKTFYDFALEDLDIAEKLFELNCSYDNVAFHCQQFCEKLIKYHISLKGLDIPKSNNLVRLSKVLGEPNVIKLSPSLKDMTMCYSITQPSPNYRELTWSEVNSYLDFCYRLREILGVGNVK